MIKKNSLFWCSFLVITAFFSGCATLPSPKLPMPLSLAATRINVGSVNYLSASSVAQSVRGQEQWDPESRVWSLMVGSHEMRATPQMLTALVDGVPEKISSPVILRDGHPFLPEFFWDQWISHWTVPLSPSGKGPVIPGMLGTIIVDPGHGGHDPGAIGWTGLREKAVTLDVALRLRDLLSQDGFRVVMTRQTDQFIPLEQRSEIANGQKAGLFISIHVNSSRRHSISGFEVYYLSEATDDHARAIEAMENQSFPFEAGSSTEETKTIVWDLVLSEQRRESNQLAFEICQSLRRELSSKNRGVKSARFAVLKGSRMPSVLVEAGFISHPAEENRLRDPAYRQRLAQGIRDGILTFARSYEQRT